MDVDPVEQWAGDALLVARHHRGRAGAGLLGVAVLAARARVHRADQDETGREGD